VDVKKDGDQYTVISWNEVGVETHDFYRDKTVLIKGGTSSPAELVKKTGALPPRKHEYEFRDRRPPEKDQKSRGKGKLADVRSDGWVDKCYFCIHRVRKGLDPYCVASCPSGARVFGDKNDLDSEVSKLLKKYKPMRLKNNRGEFLKEGEDGTKPNVFYIRNFKAKAKAS
jgi:ferredoxin